MVVGGTVVVVGAAVVVVGGTGVVVGDTGVVVGDTVGVVGEATGCTAGEGVDRAPIPAGFQAETWNAYETAESRPITK